MFCIKDIGFVKEMKLQPGNRLVDSKGNVLVVEEKKLEITDEFVKVYNFKVNDFHTYHLGNDGILVHNANYKTETGKIDIEVSKSDLDQYRQRLGVSETHTVAVGKTDVPGLEGQTFCGASPKVRQEAGLPSLDKIAPNREIKAPTNVPLNRNHAEEELMHEFVEAVKKAGLKPDEVRGTLNIIQSNPRGVCPTCLQELSDPNVSPGCI